jgi:predicted O-methyltransferase YrrM
MSKFRSVLQRFFSLSKMPVTTPQATKNQIETYDVTDYADQIDLTRLDVVTWTPAWLSRAERLMIYTLIFSLRPQRYLEIGTFQGGSALMFDGIIKDG